ncbi:GWT1 (YJL091C) [Zygosaccharomyces parabailii]|nr:GWT1 (YJL091C) [Zygosaccharomyces parabailii]CDH10825.1 related to GWT1-Protein involved in the inositol acylation of glucosaminyl phosphatidylinositol (GlcN-PI) to form glucosaminyl(acyl)phosphatidylinositol (GlcN(acyl)PI) [Zygosaccharomyces bailii ISA1307]
MSALLKERKEEFVTGLTGGSIKEINFVTGLAPLTYLCWNLLSSAQCSNLFADFALNWVCLLLAITTYSGRLGLLYTLIFVPCASIFILSRLQSAINTTPSKKNTTVTKVTINEFKLVKKPFLTAYRSSMLILTVLAILAVDFHVFPRRFGKVETWGTSLMDLGVGSFVFSNGLVTSRALLKEQMYPTKRMGLAKKSALALKSMATLLIIGLLRLFFVKNLEYQEHVTEYGVHWNFFITLSLLPPVLVFLEPLTNYIPRFMIATLISVAYELVLSKNEKALNFLILAPRTDFLSANREGIVSFLGYCSIFLWGQTTGFYLLGNKATKNNLYKPSVVTRTSAGEPSFWDKWTTVSPLTGLGIWTIVFFLLLQYVLPSLPFDVSRRFANLPYVIWVVGINQGGLLIYCLIDMLFGLSETNYKTSAILEALNSNGLIMFLISNVATGIVNMSMVTIDASEIVGLSVLLLYSLFLCTVAVVLYRRHIFVKL